MLFLLRKIRRKLLSSDNKVISYLLYAIGEIILVVVGILIALQVGEWQEAKIDLKNESTILLNIQKDVQSDTLDLSFNLKYHQVYLENEKKLLNYMLGNENVVVTEISFANALGSPLYSVIHEASFTNLQNNDLSIISNNDLKQQISRHYDFFVRAINGLENTKNEYEYYSVKLPYFTKYFSIGEQVSILSNEDIRSKQYYNPDFERTEFKLIDKNGLLRDDGFKIILSESIFTRQTKILFYMDFLDRSKEINDLIELEIQRLKSK